MINTDTEWMREALAEADAAELIGEVPIGAIVVDGENQIVGRGHNVRETQHDPTGHAEIVALRDASRTLRSWRLERCTMYVTLEPCAMCAGALVNARMKRVVWGCDDPKAGAVVTLYTIGQDPRLNHRFTIERGVLEAECADRLKRFFASLRAQGKK